MNANLVDSDEEPELSGDNTDHLFIEVDPVEKNHIHNHNDPQELQISTVIDTLLVQDLPPGIGTQDSQGSSVSESGGYCST